MSSDVRVCSVARTLELVGAKWTLLAVRELLLGNHRFEDIARFTGAPRDILTARLRTLEAEGLLTRVQYQERPPRFEYDLTAAGRELAGALRLLAQWGAARSGEPAPYQHHRCGTALEHQWFCPTCSQSVDDPDDDLDLA